MALGEAGWYALWMLPWIGIALAILFVGYVAWQASQARERARNAPAAPPGPDPVHELEQVNTELARLATQSRQTLERARDEMRRGLKG